MKRTHRTFSLEDCHNLEDEINPNPGRYIPDPRTDAERIEDQEYEDYQDTIDSLLVELRPV